MISPDSRARRLLRAHLSPGQRSDYRQTCWFNVRCSEDRLWRVYGGAWYTYVPSAPTFANLVDEYGRGRTMYSPSHEPHADVALAILLFLTSELAWQVAAHACSSRANTISPLHPALARHYHTYGEPRLGAPYSPSVKTTFATTNPSLRQVTLEHDARMRHRDPVTYRYEYVED